MAFQPILKDIGELLDDKLLKYLGIFIHVY